jgi:hypothetical protein
MPEWGRPAARMRNGQGPRLGRAVEQASAEGATLRRCWPAYQVIEGLRTGTELAWLGEHLLVLEIHPWLT